VHITIGTSGREEPFEKGYERPLNDPREVFPKLQTRLQKSAGSTWALVLGTEDDGLSSEEAALCDQLIRIPTSTQNSSMNVAMACGALLYHWRLLQLDADSTTTTPTSQTPFYNPESLAGSKSEVSGKNRWSSAQEKEKWIDYLISVLDRTQFFKYPDRESVKGRIRRWLQGTEIPLGELLFAFEVLYQIEAWGSREFKERNFLGN
jgi:tRNA C32,U32 (ribose-2'-O)-methylase TrmJ